MAKLAEAMGVGVMSLYYYFPSKAELLEAATDRIFSRFSAPEAEVDWESAIRQWVEAVGRFFLANPLALDLITRDGRVSPVWLRTSLPMLHILRRAGFQGPAFAFAAGWLVNVVMGFVASERVSFARGEPFLPLLDTLTPVDKALIEDVNLHFSDAFSTALVSLVAESVVDGLRRLLSKTDRGELVPWV